MVSNVLLIGADSLYTKMIAHFLRKYEINFDIVLIEKKQVRPLSPLKKITNLLNSGAFKSLSIFNYFTYFLILERLVNRRNIKIQEIRQKYENEKLVSEYRVDSVNSPKFIELITSKSVDYMLLGSCPILKEKVIKSVGKLVINAHPGPLPECRGGGALECTLYKNLQPTVTTHVVEPEVDAGQVLKRYELKIQSDDNFITLTHRLEELCALAVVDTLKLLLEGALCLRTEKINVSKLHYWKDWTARKQLIARINLMKLK